MRRGHSLELRRPLELRGCHNVELRECHTVSLNCAGQFNKIGFENHINLTNISVIFSKQDCNFRPGTRQCIMCYSSTGSLVDVMLIYFIKYWNYIHYSKFSYDERAILFSKICFNCAEVVANVQGFLSCVWNKSAFFNFYADTFLFVVWNLYNSAVSFGVPR